MEKYNRVAVGGTFDKFHYGHRSLIAKAFEIGKSVEIGVTSNAFAGLKEGDIDPCDFHISRLDDAYGPTVVDPDFDAIVVSEETEPNALKINDIRVEKGMKPLDIVVVKFVLADDGIPISSTRIRKGEINKKGELI